MSSGPLGFLDGAAKKALYVGGLTTGCLLAFALLFPHAAKGAVLVWIASPTFNHCFLVLPVALFLIWQRRIAIEAVPVAPNPWGIIAVLVLSFLWTIARLAGILEVEQFVVLTMVQATFFAVLGGAMYRQLAAPVLYLYFLIPSGAYLVPVLQDFTARFAVAGLQLLHIPVFSDGAVIEIPAGRFAIAEACAGLRFLVSSVAFGVFFAVLTYRSVLRRILFVGLSIVVPVVANGIRALGLIAAAEWIGSPAAAMADHVLYGWIFFSLVLVVLIGIGNLFSDRSEKHALFRAEAR